MAQKTEQSGSRIEAGGARRMTKNRSSSLSGSPVQKRMSREQMDRLRAAILIVADIGLLVLSFQGAFHLRVAHAPESFLRDLAEKQLLYVQVTPLLLLLTLSVRAFFKFYNWSSFVRPKLDKALDTVLAVGLSLFILMGLAFFQRTAFSRLILLYHFCFSSVLLASAHVMIDNILRRKLAAGHGISRTIITGDDTLAEELKTRLRDNPSFGREIVGVFREFPKNPSSLEALAPDEIILADGSFSHRELATFFRRNPNVRLRIMSNLHSLLTLSLTQYNLVDIPLLTIQEPPLARFSNRALKRAEDLALSLTGLTVCCLPMIVIAVVVKLTSRGPVFYRQSRLGRNGRPFTVYKFRSMIVDAEKDTGPVWSEKGDLRSTPFGSLLRRTSLDELPQLFNVLKGEMSIVGPRPERPFFSEKFEQNISKYTDRLLVKTGMTGLAQVYGLRGNTSISERTRYDLYYIENWSLLLDIRIILRTLVTVLFHRDAY